VLFLLLCVVRLRRREASFIGVEEGVIWKSTSSPHERYKPTLNRCVRCVELGRDLVNRLRHVGKGSPRKMGPFGLTSGANTPWLGLNVPVFGGSPPLILVTWPM
jgi:hypothetical protein